MDARVHLSRALLVFAALAVACAVLCNTAPRRLQAQAAAGTLTGRILDAQTGRGIAHAEVEIVGTTLSTQSDVGGRFRITNVPVGLVSLRVRLVGYRPKTVTEIRVGSTATVEQSVTLDAAPTMLASVEVTAAAERGTVNAALDAQRTAIGVVSAITADQIAASPDGDAAQAVQRVSGVTVQDGRYVFVRGLGERYTTTSLNGARVPSPEPEKKVVPLDLFPAGLLQTITTTKTFTPDQPGDFSGASVDIRTREFPARSRVTFSSSAGYNGRATGQAVPSARGVGGEWLAWVGSGRSVPAPVAAQGDFVHSTLSNAEKNRLANSFRDVWTPGSRDGMLNSSFSASAGGNTDALLGHRIGYLASATYGYSQQVHDRAERALALRGDVEGATVTSDRFVGMEAGSSVLWGGLLNVGTLLGESSHLTLNSTYDRTADNMARTERGSFESDAFPARIDLLDYVQRVVFSTQLAGEHQVGERQRLDWSGTFSGVRRDEPDRSEFVYEIANPDTPNEQLLWVNTGNQGAVRTFAQLHEDSYEGRANYQYQLGATRRSLIKVGGLFRRTTRTSDATSYSLSAPRLSQELRALSAEQLFDGRFANADTAVFEIAPLGIGGSYDALDNLAAGYAMAEVALSSRYRLIGGARVEHNGVTLDAASTLGTPNRLTRDWWDVLPSLALNVSLGSTHTLRFSASQTLARPEYRELAAVGTFDVINSDVQRGNPALERTRIYNGDLRWEWYPNSGEVLSVAVFGKHFEKPIERAYLGAGSAQPLITWINAASADDYGIELEARKKLGFLAGALAPLTAFSNLTVMHSQIRVANADVVFTNQKRRMVGQAPYVVNAGLTYGSASGAASATVLFNRVGERIVAAGADPLPDVVERPRNALDVSLRFPLLGEISGRFDAKNVLDASVEQVQGTVIRERYFTGRVLQFGLVWKQ